LEDEELFSVEVDRNNLDTEWVVHPIKVSKISKLVADAERERDYKKFELEIIESELDKIAREEKSSKSTEAAIKNWVKLRPEYQKKSKELIEANHNLKVLIGAATARGHCKYTLENVSRLWLADYFAEPYNTEMTEGIIERQRMKINKKANESMKKRKANEEKV